MTRTAKVIVSSTRASSGEYQDETGPLLVTWLRGRGFETPEPCVVADADIHACIDDIFRDHDDLPNVVLTTGGTGLSTDDQSVEAVSAHLDQELPGVVQVFFAKGMESIATAVLSRAVAGTVGNCFVMTLPGSKGAVKDGIATLDPILEHVVEMLEARGE